MNELCNVKNLSFSYSPSKKILDDISFSINKNEIVGILGKTDQEKQQFLIL